MVNQNGFMPKMSKKQPKGNSGLAAPSSQPKMPVSKKTDPMHTKPNKRGTVKGVSGR